MRPLTCALLLVLMTFKLFGQSATEDIRLWQGPPPGALGTNAVDIPIVTTYIVPTNVATGAAMVICPGGGYGGLAGHEGRDYALYLNQSGISCFVLRFRLGSAGYRHPIMLQDAARAVRWVRANAKRYGIDPKKIGIMGSSAGGHLASTLVTHFDAGNPAATDAVDRESSRPDVGVLCYPVISMGEFTHQGSKNNLLGKAPQAELVELLSNEKQVTAQTPPCFVWHTWEDGGVKVENSLLFAQGLRQAGVRFDLHVYEKGGHGIGLADKFPYENVHPWAKDLVFWFKAHGFTK